MQVGDLIVSDLHHPDQEVTTYGDVEASPLILGLHPGGVESGEGLHRLERKFGGPCDKPRTPQKTNERRDVPLFGRSKSDGLRPLLRPPKRLAVRIASPEHGDHSISPSRA